MEDRDRFSTADAFDNDLLKQFIVGKGFVFLPSSALKHSSFAWLERLTGAGQTNSTGAIIPLFGRDPLQLFGVKIKPTVLDKLCLANVTSDKPIYKAEKDTVNLLVLNPLTPNVKAQVDVYLNEQEFSRHRVELGAHGEGKLVLRDLPVGDYEVYLEAEERCSFTVAEYRLVPLVASVASMRAESPDRVAVVLQVESFGAPISGDINVFVMDDDRRTAALKATCKDGQMNLTVDLKGSGPHSLQLQVVADPMKTASVPLRGTRKEERAQTIFSPLGTEVMGSLLPDPTACEVRGIYLADGAIRTSPFRLERVDSDLARIVANINIEKATVVAINPTHPHAMSCVVDRKSASHPEEYDSEYTRASKLFNESGDFAGACKIFEERRAQHDMPHPYYSYWIACCKAKMGDLEGALVDLKRSLTEGWDEFEHLAGDADLAALRGHPEFEVLVSGGTKEYVFDNLTPGQVIEVPGFSPATVLAIGAMVNGKAWEGWTSLIVPSKLGVVIETPTNAVPGKRVEIEVKCAKKGATVYGIVKDARLLSSDTALTRLASGIKAYVEASGKALPVAFAQTDLASILQQFNSVTTGSYGAWSPPPAGGSPFALGASFGAAAPMEVPQASVWGSPGGGVGYDAGSGGMSGSGWGSPASRQLLGKASLEGAVELKSYSATYPLPTKPVMTSDPEVLFAGFANVVDGVAKLSVDLPDCFADYTVECFAVEKLDWSFAEASFKAEKYPFISLTTPTFSSPSEYAQGRLHVVAANQKVRVQLLKDGKPIELRRNGIAVSGGEVMSGSHDLEFVAHPGLFEAKLMLEDSTIVSETARRVDQPGKLKRRVRSLRLLEQGQSIAIADGGDIVRLQAMPGIQNSFKLLVDATADYSHCCCEQTAAKIVSGCAMYMLAEDDDRRKKAEAVILAGIRREKQMWIKGKGFKAYPEGPNHPESYLGQKAASYLWNLSLLNQFSAATGGGGNGGSGGGGGNGDSGNGGGGSRYHRMSNDLQDAINEGLAMAKDATSAYKQQFPPQTFASCADAYAALRFSSNGTAEKALGFVEKTITEIAKKNGKTPKPANLPPYMGWQVSDRMEKSYAAASLLRAGGASNLTQALKLADEVVSQFNEEGRLYSTCDSVAAIALLSELNAAKVTGGGAEVEINGKKMNIQDAHLVTDPMTTVKVLKGVAAVASDRIVEEDWNKFSMTVGLKVALEKDGKAVSKLAPGDAVNLVVTLEDGYVTGDLLWVCLPDALSRVIGGGQIKLFSLDFAGQSKLVVPLATTAITEGADGKPQAQTFAVCVRNMFDEERGGSPGAIPVTVVK